MKQNAVSTLLNRLIDNRKADFLRYIRMRVRSDADANDIAQDAYLRFIRLAKPEAIENPEAYLFRIAANLIWEHQLKSKNSAVREEELAMDYSASDSVDGPQDFAVSEEITHHVRATLAELPPRAGQVLTLYLRDNLKSEEIAIQLGISLSMVKKHKRRALAHCRSKLRERYETKLPGCK